MIRFLVKSTFWLSVALFFIPLAPGETDGERQVGAIDAFFAAKEAVSDVTGICARQPDVCEVGSALVGSLGERAREGARIAYETLDKQFGTPVEPALAPPLDVPMIERAASPDEVTTGSVPLPAARF